VREGESEERKRERESALGIEKFGLGKAGRL
jgi:hypothetical protein